MDVSIIKALEPKSFLDLIVKIKAEHCHIFKVEGDDKVWIDEVIETFDDFILFKRSSHSGLYLVTSAGEVWKVLIEP